jgi:threonine/homoserine/homoserine lactone efflux protein
MAIRNLISKGKQHASTIIFLFGFITDAYLLPEVENPITKYLGLTYLVWLAVLILAREWVVARNTASSNNDSIRS